MTFAAKRRLDYLVGESLCVLLKPWVRALGIVMRRDRTLSAGFRRVWVIKFVGMGSLLNATPFLRALRRAYPEAEVSLLTFPGTRVLAARLPQFDHVLTVRDDSMLHLAWDCLRVIVRAWRERPELLVDLEVHSAFSTLISVLTMARNRAGFYHGTALFREGLHTHLLYFNRFMHLVDCYLQLGKALGCPDEEPTLEGDLVTEADRAEFAEYRTQLPPGLGRAPFLAVNPNTSPMGEERKWPAASFARLIEELLGRGEWSVYLLGSPSERPTNDAILELLPAECLDRVHNAAGETSFGGALALLEQAELLITVDSGLAHLGAASGTPLVCLSGPSWPEATAPRGERCRVVYKPLYCSPCLFMTDEPPCAGDNLCMQRIGWEDVLVPALELLGVPDPGEGDAVDSADTSGYLPGYLVRPAVAPLSSLRNAREAQR